MSALFTDERGFFVGERKPAEAGYFDCFLHVPIASPPS